MLGDSFASLEGFLQHLDNVRCLEGAGIHSDNKASVLSQLDILVCYMLVITREIPYFKARG